jgi:hypothetical protein
VRLSKPPRQAWQLLGWLLSGSLATTQACVLELHHRQQDGGQWLMSQALAEPRFTLAFEHSVLHTTVQDDYQLQGSSGAFLLLAERFSGEGYGLPHTAAEGETLTQQGNQRQLNLRRVVSPLVVRPLAAERMRLLVGGQSLALSDISNKPIVFSSRCP